MAQHIKVIVTGDVSDWNMSSFSVEQLPEEFRRMIASSDLFIPALEGMIKVADHYPKARWFQNRILNRGLNLFLDLSGKRQPTVYSSPNILELFTLCSKTCVVMANNHIKDLGGDGISDTVRLLHEREIACVGAGRTRREANRPCQMDVFGKRVIILNYNYIGLRKFGCFLNIYGATRLDPGAGYLNPADIRSVIARLRAESENPFIFLVLHAGRMAAHTVEETRVDYRSIEALGADCNVYHHSHRYFGPPSPKSFFLGDFIFHDSLQLRDDRMGGFLEIDIDPSNNSFSARTHVYSFKEGLPDPDRPDCTLANGATL
jgi:hypothetical protein